MQHVGWVGSFHLFGQFGFLRFYKLFYQSCLQSSGFVMKLIELEALIEFLVE